MTVTQSGDESSRPITRSMRSTVGRESTTFGFSILITVTFAMTETMLGSPTVLQIFLYAIGAVMSFTVLEGVLSNGFRRPMPQHATQTMTLGTSLNVFSVVAALGAAWGIADVTRGLLGWSLAPLVAGAAYLLVESVEDAVAERVLVASGDKDAERVTNQDT
jgi:hypothetical protein